MNKEELFKKMNPQDGELPKWAAEFAIEYSNTQNSELLKEVSRLYHSEEHLKKELEEAKAKLKQTKHHLKILISGFDGIHDACKEEYGESYPEADFVKKAKEFINE